MTIENFTKLIEIVKFINELLGLTDKQSSAVFSILHKHVKPVFERVQTVQKELYATRRELDIVKRECTMYKSFVQDGKLYCTVDSTDCDMMSSTRAYEFNSVQEFLDFEENSYEWAEGTMYIELITKEMYEEFMPSTRDRIMEAYENGRGNSIYV